MSTQTTSNSTIEIEQQIIETVSMLEPDDLQTVLKFVQFLRNTHSHNDKAQPPEASDDSTATAQSIDLAEKGISCAQAADLRHRLETFAEDWNHPTMDVYDRQLSDCSVTRD